MGAKIYWMGTKIHVVVGILLCSVVRVADVTCLQRIAGFAKIIVRGFPNHKT